MNRFVTILTTLALLMGLATPVFATETTQPTQAMEETASRPENACGENLTWSYASGKLTITGSGDMDSFSGGAPWDSYASSVYILELTGSVTSVGTGAFRGFSNLTDIDFGNSLREIGEDAFRDCTSITGISLPKTFRLFGPGCFQGCTGLEEVHCAGGMPSFRSNCLWNGGHITVFCPDDNIWSEKYVGELETNFHGRLEVLTESGKDVYAWPEETQPLTEATETPTQAPTEAPTEPVTVPTTAPTEVPTVPTTEAQTEPTTVPTEQTEVPAAPTEPASSQQEPLSGAIVAVFLLSGTLSLLLIGMLIFKGSRHRGKYGK